MEETNEWVIQINEELESNGPSVQSEKEKWGKPSIYKLTSSTTELNKEAYKPKTVSFGPYHNGEEHLSAVEEHKHRALIHFLWRCKMPIDSFFQRMEEVAVELRDSYKPLDTKWMQHTPKFLQMMILDGCFMLEILRANDSVPDDYADNDPVFGKHGRLNVMPYIGRFTKEPATQHVCPNPKPVCTLCPTWYSESHTGFESSITQLREAGIRFKRSETQTLRDVYFCGGVLRLPHMEVDYTTEDKFLNLIAFERHHVGAGKHVTSYMFLMDCLIDTEADVEELFKSGIISYCLESNTAVAKVFNSLGKDITLWDHPDSRDLEVVRHSMSNYCKRPWRKWRANLVQNYFQNPWTGVSLVAAIFLFALTITQTVYTILQYYLC